MVRTTVTMTMKTLSHGMLAPNSSKRHSNGKIWGVDCGDAPQMIWTMFWRMNETPMAVIRGASRGAFRSGR